MPRGQVEGELSKMARNVRIRLNVADSAATDYSKARKTEWEKALTPDETKPEFDVDALTGGTTIYLNNFTTITGFGVRNNDSTNFVTLVYDTAGTASVNIKLLAEDPFFTADVDPSTNPTLTADTATCSCSVFVYGT